MSFFRRGTSGGAAQHVVALDAASNASIPSPAAAAYQESLLSCCLVRSAFDGEICVESSVCLPCAVSLQHQFLLRGAHDPLPSAACVAASLVPCVAVVHAGLVRELMQRYHRIGRASDECFVGCLCSCCSTAQVAHELHHRGVGLSSRVFTCFAPPSIARMGDTIAGYKSTGVDVAAPVDRSWNGFYPAQAQQEAMAAEEVAFANRNPLFRSGRRSEELSPRDTDVRSPEATTVCGISDGSANNISGNALAVQELVKQPLTRGTSSGTTATIDVVSVVHPSGGHQQPTARRPPHFAEGTDFIESGHSMSEAQSNTSMTTASMQQRADDPFYFGFD